MYHPALHPVNSGACKTINSLDNTWVCWPWARFACRGWASGCSQASALHLPATRPWQVNHPAPCLFCLRLLVASRLAWASWAKLSSFIVIVEQRRRRVWKAGYQLRDGNFAGELPVMVPISDMHACQQTCMQTSRPATQPCQPPKQPTDDQPTKEPAHMTSA